MTNDKERIRIYERIRDELTSSQRSNAENFDRSILTLSSAGLGLSVVFITDLIPLVSSNFKILLYASWIIFILTILTTLVAYILGQRGIKEQLFYAQEYYLEEKEEYLKKKNKYSEFIDKYSYLTITFFIAAIISLLSFIIINLQNGGHKMANKENFKTQSKNDSVPINNLQKVIGKELKRSIPINTLQPINTPQESSGNNTNSTTDSKETKKDN